MMSIKDSWSSEPEDQQPTTKVQTNDFIDLDESDDDNQQQPQQQNGKKKRGRRGDRKTMKTKPSANDSTGHPNANALKNEPSAPTPTPFIPSKKENASTQSKTVAKSNAKHTKSESHGKRKIAVSHNLVEANFKILKKLNAVIKLKIPPPPSSFRGSHPEKRLVEWIRTRLCVFKAQKKALENSKDEDKSEYRSTEIHINLTKYRANKDILTLNFLKGKRLNDKQKHELLNHLGTTLQYYCGTLRVNIARSKIVLFHETIQPYLVLSNFDGGLIYCYVKEIVSQGAKVIKRQRVRLINDEKLYPNEGLDHRSGPILYRNIARGQEMVQGWKKNRNSEYIERDQKFRNHLWLKRFADVFDRDVTDIRGNVLLGVLFMTDLILEDLSRYGTQSEYY
eukprot:36997_1